MQVKRALSEEIRRLSVLVEEFNAPFHADPLVLNLYKRELHAHIESGLGSNLRARLSNALTMNIESSQREMTGKLAYARANRKNHDSKYIFHNSFG